MANAPALATELYPRITRIPTVMGMLSAHVRDLRQLASHRTPAAVAYALEHIPRCTAALDAYLQELEDMRAEVATIGEPEGAYPGLPGVLEAYINMGLVVWAAEEDTEVRHG